MLKRIDSWVNSVTMYYLTMRGLIGLAGVAFIASVFGEISYSPLSLVLSLGVLFMVCVGGNYFSAKALNATPSVESGAITALILFFLMIPSDDVRGLGAIALAGLIATASKYVIAYRKRHLFNPAAIGALMAGLVVGFGAIWWVGTPILLPFVAVLGVLVARKIRRTHLFVVGALACIASVIIVQLVLGTVSTGQELWFLVRQLFGSWPVIFFCSIMLTEPATTPPKKTLQIVYAVMVGALFGLPVHLGPLYMSPELALLIGNLFSYLVSSKERVMLRVRQVTEVAKDTYHISFNSSQKLHFEPGQYLEWTLPHRNPDSRGNRRYFTIASAPGEDLAIGVKIIDQASSFKRALKALGSDGVMSAAQLAGDFVLPKNVATPLVFIAGGIGVTPFRSMIAHMVAQGEKRDIILLYACATPPDFAYLDLFQQAEILGLRVVCIAATADNGWAGRTGRLEEALLKTEVPDFAQRHFYLSGPPGMVDAGRGLLKKLGVARSRVTTDYFPGL